MTVAFEQQYLDLLNQVATFGEKRGDRTGTGTRSVFAPAPMKFDLSNGDSFPLITTKKVAWKSVVGELLWMLSGSVNVQELRDRGVTIWDEWEQFDGTIGPGYGQQWRGWEQKTGVYIDQIATLIERIKFEPESRRLIVNAWNVGELDEMALPPCHMFFQCYVRGNEDGTDFLDLQLYQRSADLFLGAPFNIASYALLLRMLARVTDLQPGVFTHVFGDAHIYENHLEQVKTQLSRKPLEPPQLRLDGVGGIDDFVADDIKLFYYKHHPGIKADVAV